MTIDPDNLSSVISGIIALGANGGEEIYLPRIHSVLCQMKPHTRMLAGLWFTITGSVCYSREIENTLLDLAALGVLKIESGTTAVVKDAELLRARFRRTLPARQYRRILAASRRFYGTLWSIRSASANLAMMRVK